MNWETVASLATALGTLILAVATFSSVRSANRTALAAERSLRANLRPLLIPSRLQDDSQKVGFGDDHFVKLVGGAATAEVGDNAVYLTMSLRNAGSGLGVLDAWCYAPDRVRATNHENPSNFRRLTRDLYIPPGDLGFWQGAFRDTEDSQWQDIVSTIKERQAFTLEIMYTDLEGGQRTITRYGVIPKQKDDDWIAAVSRHWVLDGTNPRG